MAIPARVHFCWIGTVLSWAHVFAVLSAAERGEMAEIILHHTDALQDGAELRALRAASRVRLAPIEADAYLAETGDRLGVGGELVALYRRIDDPASRTDILRAAILYRHGGVYLDMDTVTTATLRPLLDDTQFVGAEFIVWPPRVRASRSPAVWAFHLGLDLLRKALRSVPHGWKMFRRVEHLYVRGINNAIIGAEPRGRLIADYLRAMVRLPHARQTRRYALGPHLLQEVVDRYPHGDLTVQEPLVFYPLPPEISEHWFRPSRGATLDAVLTGETRVVHWYASVHTSARVAQITPAYVLEHRKLQLYSMLVYACIHDLPQMA